MKVVLLACAAGLVAGGSAWAQSNLGFWTENGRAFNDDGFGSILRDTLSSRGNIIENDGGLSAANLANDTHFTITEPRRAPNQQEIADVRAWVNAGGVLVLTTDSSFQGGDALNTLLSGVGSQLRFVNGDGSNNTPLQAGSFATEGPPFNIVGQTLQTTPWDPVTGGSAVTGDYIRFEQIGRGIIFAFGDAHWVNVFPNGPAQLSGRLHINIYENVIPAPGAAAVLGLGALAGVRRRR